MRYRAPSSGNNFWSKFSSIEGRQCDQIGGNLLDFGQLFKTIILTKSPTFLVNYCKGVKIFNFSSEIILGNFYRHLSTFYWSHWRQTSRQADSRQGTYIDRYIHQKVGFQPCLVVKPPANLSHSQYLSFASVRIVGIVQEGSGPKLRNLFLDVTNWCQHKLRLHFNALFWGDSN